MEDAVVTIFCRSDSDILLSRCPDHSLLNSNVWDGYSVSIDSKPSDESVAEKVSSEIGNPIESVTVVRLTESPITTIEKENRQTEVYASLVDVQSQVTEIDNREIEWASPQEILTRATVPWLWDAYDRIRPSVRSIAADSEHGAAYLSIRALEVIRDQAAILAQEPGDRGDELQALGDRLCESRPSMAVLHNRVKRVLSEGMTTKEILQRANKEIQQAVSAQKKAATTAMEAISPNTILTHSRSDTVKTTIQMNKPQQLYVAESRPEREGIKIAEDIKSVNTVTVHTDAALAHVLSKYTVDAVLVGADTILRDGSVVNKTGTRTLAIAAFAEDTPVYVVSAADKITGKTAVSLEHGETSAIYNGKRDINVLNPVFDVTPAKYITQYLTDKGVFTPDEINEVTPDNC